MSEPHPFPIVGVGASAGGLDPVRRLLRGLSSTPGLAIVIVEHLDPTHQSRLSEILAGDSPIPVLGAVHGLRVKVDHAYVIQPNTSVAIADGVLAVTVRPEPRHAHYPIDHFFRSLAAVQGPLAVGVVLSGTGSDGTSGANAIKAAGGVVFAQDEASAQHTGMIKSAVASGAIDAVLSPEAIAERLLDLPRHPYLRTAEEAELLQSNRNRDLDTLTDDLSNFIASADVPMVTVDRELHIRRLTAAATRAFNVLPSDTGRSIEHIRFVLDVDPVAMRQVIVGVVESGQSWERDVMDREGRWWVLRVRPFITSDKRVEGATLVALDIDSAKRSSELIEARDYAMAVVQTVREPLVVLDMECRVRLANEAYYRLVGEGPEDTEGCVLWETGRGLWAVPPLRRAMRSACSAEGPLVDFEIQRMLPDRGLRTLVLNAQNIVRAGRPGLLLVSIEDVTDLRQAEALRIDAETLRMMDRRKDEFLGILAHELRNPLAPMRFALELMRRSRDEGELTRARQVLERQVAHMVRIVDDLLDVSRITQGKVELRKERLSLSDVIQAAVELCRPSIAAAQHVLTVSLPDPPVIVNGDTVRLTQVFVNLLNNAIKFTPHGGHIWLIAEKTGEPGEEPDHVHVRVRDTGIGIPGEIRTRIFEMFMQGDRSLERTRGGLGVGLTLVRNLVALHGGSIEARSEGTGQGSEFIVTLPIEVPVQAQEQETAQAQTAPVPARPLRILVADDNQDGREMLEYLLTKEGHTVVSAENGERAVELAREFPCDVAVLDIGMPGLNGYQVAERLRQFDHCPLLVALSGLGQAEDKTRAAAAGFDRHFTKPVDIGALMAVIAERLVRVIPSGHGAKERTYDEQDAAGDRHGADPD